MRAEAQAVALPRRSSRRPCRDGFFLPVGVTQDSYVRQISLFARHFNKSPEILGPEEIRSYQLYLTNEKKLAPSSILIAIAALRFLYKVTLHKDWSLEEIIPAPFLANRYREQKLARCRELLDMPAPEPPALEGAEDYRERYKELIGPSFGECPVCHQGRMLVIETDPQRPSVLECDECEGRSTAPLHSRSVRCDELNF